MIKEGDMVVLYDRKKRKSCLYRVSNKQVNIYCGRMNLADVIGREFGDKISTHTGYELFILKPTIEDIVMQGVRRVTQVIYPKDAALIIMKSGIKSGDRVIEVGCGSGSFTIALANFLGPSGRVYSYEKREDIFQIALQNIELAGGLVNVEVKNKEVKDKFDETDVDFVMLDLPVPWELLGAVNYSLKSGCRCAAILPTVNQTERFVFTLEESGYVNIEVIECLVRKILVRKGKTRPEQLMPSHTGYLIFATKVSC